MAYPKHVNVLISGSLVYSQSSVENKQKEPPINIKQNEETKESKILTFEYIYLK